jgi:hypothetical protein
MKKASGQCAESGTASGECDASVRETGVLERPVFPISNPDAAAGTYLAIRLGFDL